LKELLACEFTSPLQQKLGCFVKPNFLKFIYSHKLAFLLKWKLSGKPEHPLTRELRDLAISTDKPEEQLGFGLPL